MGEVKPVGILAKVALADLSAAEMARLVGILTQTAPEETGAALRQIERDRANGGKGRRK